MSERLELFGFFRSGTSHRTRIALNLKGLAYAYRPVNLRTREHASETYLFRNPQGLVPTLVVDGRPLIQSPAIIEWLEENYPSPPLLPREADGRAKVRALAAIIGCDTHPLNNLRVLNYLRNQLGHSEDDVRAWCECWVLEGLRAFEAMVHRLPGGRFSFGNTPTLADVYLIPQLVGARRFAVDLAPFPTLLEIESAAMSLSAFADAAPELQPDHMP